MTRRSETARAGRPDASKAGRAAQAGLTALLLITLSAPNASAQSQQQPPPSAGVEVVDRMVATVNGQLITYTDLLWQLALEPGTPLDRPRAEDLRKVLETVIDQRIIYHEAEKLPHIHAGDSEVEPALAELVKRFPSQTEFQRRVASVGLTSGQLREIVRERVEIEKYVNFRFRSFTVVTPQEAEGYYRDVYVPRRRRQSPGAIVPALKEVYKEIEGTLTEDKVASDLAKFFDEVRNTAEIEIINQP
jgi:hypothetical protein